MKSEVASLMQRIRDENEAMQRGIAGVAVGAAKHSFISARMEHMGALKDELAKEVGEIEATTMWCKAVLGE